MPLPRPAIWLFAALPVLLSAPARAGGGFDDPALVARLLPSVVAVEPQLPPLDGQTAPRKEHATGFVIDPDGTILTNGHVVEGAQRLLVTLQDGTVLPARVLYEAPIDLAIIRVQAGHPLPAVRWGESDALRPGDGVIAIGNPLGIGISVSAGIVSAIGRDIHATPHDDFIQTDAALNHGNSGGPLFNLKGEVIGVATGLISPKGATGSVGLGLAIPGDTAQFVAQSFRQYGRLREGWTGASFAPVTPGIADSLDLPPGGGAIVTDVPANTPAARAGLRPGDVVLRADDQPIASPRALARQVMLAPVGGTLHLALRRGGMDATADLVLGEAPQRPTPPLPSLAPAPTGLGLALAPLDATARAHWHMAADAPGVLIRAVAPDSEAAANGIAPGDVIARVQWGPATTPEDIDAAIAAAQGTGRGHVLLALRGKDGLRLVALPVRK